jgi:hypothetical protein
VKSEDPVISFRVSEADKERSEYISTYGNLKAVFVAAIRLSYDSLRELYEERIRKALWREQSPHSEKGLIQFVELTKDQAKGFQEALGNIEARSGTKPTISALLSIAVNICDTEEIEALFLSANSGGRILGRNEDFDNSSKEKNRGFQKSSSKGLGRSS